LWQVGPRRPPIQLGLALAPALTCCLSAARFYASAHRDSRRSTGTGALAKYREGSFLNRALSPAEILQLYHLGTVRITQ